MIRKTSTTAPKPQDIMSRKDRLKVVKPRFLRRAMAAPQSTTSIRRA